MSVLRTSRLTLRPPRPDDAPALFRAYTSDAEVTKFLVWSPHTSIQETHEFVESRLAKWQSGEAFAWVLSLNVSQEAIGMIELTFEDASIGYVLGRRWWNAGIMSEALDAVVRYAIETLHLTTLRAWCDEENIGSSRVLTKNGFVLEGAGPGPLPHSGFNNQIRPALFYVYHDSKQAGDLGVEKA